MNKEYKFYKYKNNPEGSDYCFCQRPVDSNMSLRCFLENGEILGFMSESLVYKYPKIKEIDMDDFMHNFVRPLIKKNYNLEKENNQFKSNWKALKEWLEDNWKSSQDIWFVKIITKMNELEGDK